MLVKLFQHTCNQCGHKFFAPDLGDFSYGIFLLWSDNFLCRYLNVFEDKTYDEFFDLFKQKNNYETVEVIQEKYGLLVCDKDNFGKSFIISPPPCPNCNSRLGKNINTELYRDIINVEQVTHVTWNQLTKEAKLALI